MLRSCQSLVHLLLQLLLVLSRFILHQDSWHGQQLWSGLFPYGEETVDLNKTWPVEQSAPPMVLVSSRCHFGLPSFLLQNLKGANVYSGDAKRSRN